MLNQGAVFIFALVVLLFSAILHEISHGVSAKLQGDNTAEAAGRLTLNPLPHLDFFGSIILPLMLALPALFGAPVFIIGWAKPVPFNPNNLRNKRWGPALVALAGPLINIFIAIFFGAILRISYLFSGLPLTFNVFLMVIIWINLLLAVFNLIPIPPLDGSKLLFSLFPLSWAKTEIWLERYGFILLLFFVLFGFDLILPPITFLFSVIAGQPFGF
ncbi:MAG: site-2 protease family protein [Candidatus Azambacteria bacterium]|nr:site-2 protease family protein [Candidatus Azambacteria bacterium]